MSLQNPQIQGVHVLISQLNTPGLLVACHGGDWRTMSSKTNEPYSYKVKRSHDVWSAVLYDLVRFTYNKPSEDEETHADAALLWSETLAELEQLPHVG